MRTFDSAAGRLIAAALPLLLAGLAAGCARSKAPDRAVIQNTGSDTLVNLAQAWAEEYAQVNPAVSVEVSGGGTGTGVAALINGTVDIANCSRKLEPQEVEKAKQHTGRTPREYLVGYDALAVYVHKSNPLEEITLAQLGEIYAEGGKTTRWSQLGVKPPGGSDEIIRISRQSNSGTYYYFREAVLGHGRDFKLGSRDMHGSKDVVELVSHTPGAIGYSGMGYAAPGVKALRVARKAGEKAYAPTMESALDGTYPIARPLFLYTLGEPAGAIRQYLDWIYSGHGQKVVADNGYVPLPKTGASR